MLTKVMKMHILLAIAQCVIAIVTFDLWISKTSFDMFLLVINFINDRWVPYHVRSKVV
jgi:flagellar biosynthesis/type III secretory pathway M-ring protein FliF/YscJ